MRLRTRPEPRIWRLVASPPVAGTQASTCIDADVMDSFARTQDADYPRRRGGSRWRLLKHCCLRPTTTGRGIYETTLQGDRRSRRRKG